MLEPSYEELRQNFTLAGPSRIRVVVPVVILLVAIVAGAAAFWQFYHVGFAQAVLARQDASTEIAPAMRDVDTSQQQPATDQVQSLQQDLAAQQAATRRLSDEVDALNSRMDALQQSFASAPVTVGRAPPPRRKPTPPPTAPLSIRP
jgi:uncharacterized protein HemX